MIYIYRYVFLFIFDPDISPSIPETNSFPLYLFLSCLILSICLVYHLLCYLGDNFELTSMFLSFFFFIYQFVFHFLISYPYRFCLFSCPFFSMVTMVLGGFGGGILYLHSCNLTTYTPAPGTSHKQQLLLPNSTTTTNPNTTTSTAYSTTTRKGQKLCS